MSESELVHIQPPECCSRYLRHSFDLIVEWADGCQLDGFISLGSYLDAIKDQASLCRDIVSGNPCPWHQGIPEDYLAVMHSMGGSDERV